MSEKLLPFLPSAKPETWLGVMGGGQLGRMFAHAAQKMGYKVAVLEPARDCPAGDSADHLLSADYSDPAALAALAEQCAAVTTEFENVPADSLSFLSQRTFVAPCARAVSIAQDRMAEKRFFTECGESSGVMPAPYHEISKLDDIDTIPDHLFPGILKTVRLGYDGKGQVRVNSAKEALVAFVALQEVPCVLEKMLPLAYEISVLSARGADGQAVVYPIAENVHVEGILFTTTVPSPHVAAETAAKAQAATLGIIEQLGYVGVLCIEFFVLKDGSLVVNEMAPRPHNSGHYTIDACVTSQFAQQARAMARIPLGEVRQHSPAVMLNLLGDLWYDGETDQLSEPEWDKVLALPGSNLHLYGKDEPRRGRKMGHVTFVAPTLEEAQKHLRAACDVLGIPLDE
jgi:5-(carboxyamino)imidazole ribonucleotide synthase